MAKDSPKKTKKTEEDSALTDQQDLFCREYVKDLNATQAATRAGYSADTAAQQGSRLLSYVKVQDRLSELKAAQFKRLEIQSDEILGELQKLGLSDLRKLFDDDNCILPMSRWPAEVATCVAAIEVYEEFAHYPMGDAYCHQCGRRMFRQLIGYIKKIKFWDKPKSLELLGKHKKLFTDRIEIAGATSLATRLASARKRAHKK
jgi:phage terminase small subunit